MLGSFIFYGIHELFYVQIFTEDVEKDAFRMQLKIYLHIYYLLGVRRQNKDSSSLKLLSCVHS